jgi:hypothetical protein
MTSSASATARNGPASTPVAAARAYRAPETAHLDRSAAMNEHRVEHDISRDRHRISKVAVYLVQYVFGRSVKEDGACFWGCAFGQEGEVSVIPGLDPD